MLLLFLLTESNLCQQEMTWKGMIERLFQKCNPVRSLMPSGQCSGVLIAAQLYGGNNWSEALALNFLFERTDT